MGYSNSRLIRYEGANRVAGDGTLDVAFAFEVENQNGDMPLLAGRDGGDVHDAQVLVDHFGVSETLVADGMGVFLGIFAVDAVDLGCFHDDVGFNFAGPKG